MPQRDDYAVLRLMAALRQISNGTIKASLYEKDENVVFPSIAEKHGGQITVDSGLGVGSTFTFIFPKEPLT